MERLLMRNILFSLKCNICGAWTAFRLTPHNRKLFPISRDLREFTDQSNNNLNELDNLTYQHFLQVGINRSIIFNEMRDDLP